MFNYYFKIFVRVMVKNPVFTLINLLGLVLAFSFAMLIYMHAQQELSYDNFHTHADDIYRIAWMSDNSQTRTPHPMAQAIKQDFSEVEAAVSLSPIYGPALTKTTTLFKNPKNNVMYEEPNGYLVDSTFFDVFSFEILEGSAESLKEVGGILITESMAKRFFGEESALGKVLLYDDTESPIQVLAVLKDPPLNSHFRFNFLVSYVTMKAMNPTDNWYAWADFGHFNYVRLRHGASAENLEKKIPDWVINFISGSEEELRLFKAGVIGFELQPIESIHLNSHLRWELEQNSDASSLYIFGISAVFILLVSAINFINLTTGRSVERLKEIGVKKTLGAFRHQIFRQFFFESFALVFIALFMAFGLVNLSIPQFNQLFQAHLEASMILNPVLLVSIIALAFLFTALSAFYPSVYLNAIDPGKILKGMAPGSLGNHTARNLLLGLQFFVSVLLICGSLLIHDQVDFLRSKSLGFDKENLMAVRIKNDIIVERLPAVKARLMENPAIEKVSAVSNVPGGQFNYNPVFAEENPQNRVTMAEFLIDFDALPLLGLELEDGRLFNHSYATDSLGVNYLINETAAKNLGFTEPVGKRLVWDDDDEMLKGTVVGVVKDFHFKSLHEPIKPMIMQILPRDYSYLLLKVNGKNLSDVSGFVQKVFSDFDPKNVFEYQFLDREIENLYAEESRTLSISIVFSGLCIFLAVAGLLGMAQMVLKKRIKEIGIRKVLGASLIQILWLLNAKYLKIALVALLLAVPATYWLIGDWLNNFTYQAPISPAIFVFTLLGILLLVFAVISLISLKASRSNPTKALRYE